MGDAAPQKYRAVFDDEKIGRSGGAPAHPLGLKTEPPDLTGMKTISDLDDATRAQCDRICEEVHNYARPYLTSREVDVAIVEAPGIDGGTQWRGVILVGGFRPVGHFTIVSD
jgi:hypothetical protein